MPTPITCLQKLVSVNGQCNGSTTPFSILELPGFTQDMIDAAVQKDKTGLEVINEAIILAQHGIKQTISTEIQPRFKSMSLDFFDSIGQYEDDTIPLEVGFYRGIYVRITKRSYLGFLLNTVRLLFKEDVTDSIDVIDLRTGEILEIIPFTALANQVLTVDIALSFPTRSLDMDLFIGIDGGLADMADTTLHANQFNSGCCGSYGYGCKNAYTSITTNKLPIAGPFTRNSLVGINDTGGMSIDYGIKCEIEGLMCGAGEMLGYPLWYLAGAAAVDAIKKAMNYTDTQTIHMDTLDAMHAEWKEEGNEKLKTLLISMGGRRISDGLCFECNQITRRVVRTP